MKALREFTGKTLLLIDGSSYIYRAFYAIQKLTNTQGEPTNALYGVLNMLRKIEKDYKFDYCSFVCDAKGKNFRHQLYPEYKATRRALPEELRPQIVWIKKLVDLMGWNVLVVEGVEADDVIATLHYQAIQTGMKVMISSGDKDLAQLVDEYTMVVNTMTDEILDIEGVKHKFGVNPQQMVDYLMLVGDASDNIRGVTKCGPKTAAKWLQAYGTVDNLLQHMQELTPSARRHLQEAIPWLDTARKLIQVEKEVDLSSSLEGGLTNLAKKEVDWHALLPYLRRFGFTRWTKEAEIQLGQLPEVESDSDTLKKKFKERIKGKDQYITVDTKAKWKQLKARLDQEYFFSLDTETTSLNALQARLVGISLAFQPGEAFYLPVGHNPVLVKCELEGDWLLTEFKPYLESKQWQKVGQNLKYDQQVLYNHGIHLRGIVGDSLLASYMVESHLGHGLDELAKRHLGIETIRYEELCGKGSKQISFADVAVDQATIYAGQDADLSLRIERRLVSLMTPAQKNLYQDLEVPLLEILGRMERVGVLLDREKLCAQSQALGRRIIELQEEVYARVGQNFNLNSPKQLQTILFEQLKIPTENIKKTPSGDFSTSEEVLAELAEYYEVPRLILEHRSLSKLKNTYTDKLPFLVDKDGRVHTTYAQAVANTGRLASNNPNLQNIPIRTAEGRKIREAFIAEVGYTLVSADYSQIELRIMAHLSGDERLINAFKNNEDIHQSTAAEIFHISLNEVTAEQRRYAKTINFGLIYGMGPYGLSRALKIEQAEAKLFIERYFSQYPGVFRYMEETKLSAHDKGYVETIWGRKLYLDQINARGRQRTAAERAAINAPMQGTASDLIKLAMIRIQNYLDREDLDTRMIMQVHDELVFEVPLAEVELIQRLIPALMTEVASLQVPLVVELGQGSSWEAAH
ncbi:MAG: DNA polymerase I [Neisseriaceae bacterium]